MNAFLLFRKGSMANRQFRARRGLQFTTQHSLQLLFASLHRAKARAGQSGLIWQAHTFGISGLEDTTLGHTGQLEIPLLRHSRQNLLASQPTRRRSRARHSKSSAQSLADGLAATAATAVTRAQFDQQSQRSHAQQTPKIVQPS